MPGGEKGIKKKQSLGSHDVSFGKTGKIGALGHSLQSFQKVLPGFYLWFQFAFYFYFKASWKCIYAPLREHVAGLVGHLLSR